MTANSHTPGAAANDSHSGQIQYVTVFIGGQLFGLPIHKVHDVFVPESMTRVPLSAPEVAGVLNLRGRIVTAINMRRRLGLPQREGNHGIMAVGKLRAGVVQMGNLPLQGLAGQLVQGKEGWIIQAINED